MSVLPTLFRRVYVKSRPECPKHGGRDMHRIGRAYICTFGVTDIYAKAKCDYVSTPRVRVSRVEEWTDEYDTETRSDGFGVDRESQ